jgi:hypothetical protein
MVADLCRVSDLFSRASDLGAVARVRSSNLPLVGML